MPEDEKRKRAERSDWKCLDMPQKCVHLTIEKSFTPEQMEQLSWGHIPLEMEDHWFSYFENDTYYIHRSWTGICLYIVKFTPGSDIIDVTVNRDKSQYTCTDDYEDMMHVLSYLCHYSGAPFDHPAEAWCRDIMASGSGGCEDLDIGGRMVKAVYFRSPKEPFGYLSLWYPSKFIIDGIQFTSAYQYIMYRKCMLFGDSKAAEEVLKTDSPQMQQTIAGAAKGFNPVVWNGMRQPVCITALLAKFTQNESLKKKLLIGPPSCPVMCVGSERLWGCGMRLSEPEKSDVSKWKGTNILGFALMEVRNILANMENKSEAGVPVSCAEGEKQMDTKNVIRIVKGDITDLACDAVVNAANDALLPGGGVCGSIHRAAGPKLAQECSKLGGCPTGSAVITKGYNLKAKHVIHAVGPIYSGKSQDAVQLAGCYRRSLDLCVQNGLHSIAFPSISTGIYGYPLTKAVPVAVSTVSDWLKEHEKYGIEVIFCCFDDHTLAAYKAAHSSGIAGF